jgi:hypothetical protein
LSRAIYGKEDVIVLIPVEIDVQIHRQIPYPMLPVNEGIFSVAAIGDNYNHQILPVCTLLLYHCHTDGKMLWQVGITGDGSKKYQVSYIRGLHEALQSAVVTIGITTQAVRRYYIAAN